MYLYIMYILTMQTEAFLVGGGGDGKKHCLLVPYFIYDHSTSVKVQSCFDGSVMNSVCDHNVSSSFSFFLVIMLPSGVLLDCKISLTGSNRTFTFSFRIVF